MYSDLKLTWHSHLGQLCYSSAQPRYRKERLTQTWVPETAPALWHYTWLQFPKENDKNRHSWISQYLKTTLSCITRSIPFWTLNYWTLNVLNSLSKYLLLEWLFTVKLKTINFLPTSIIERWPPLRKPHCREWQGFFYWFGGCCCGILKRGVGWVGFFESYNLCTKILSHWTAGCFCRWDNITMNWHFSKTSCQNDQFDYFQDWSILNHSYKGWVCSENNIDC